MNTVSNAWSKADTKRRTQMGALGAVAVVALWVLKRKLFGGGGGRGRRGGGYDDSEDGYSGRRCVAVRGCANCRLVDSLLSEPLFEPAPLALGLLAGVFPRRLSTHVSSREPFLPFPV